MKQILFKETTTLGVCYYPLTVHRAERRFREVSTKWGPVTVMEDIYDNIPLKKVYEQLWMQQRK